MVELRQPLWWLTQALALAVDPVSLVDEAVQNRIGIKVRAEHSGRLQSCNRRSTGLEPGHIALTAKPPRPLVNRLNTEIRAICAEPDMRARFRHLGA